MALRPGNVVVPGTGRFPIARIPALPMLKLAPFFILPVIAVPVGLVYPHLSAVVGRYPVISPLRLVQTPDSALIFQLIRFQKIQRRTLQLGIVKSLQNVKSRSLQRFSCLGIKFDQINIVVGLPFFLMPVTIHLNFKASLLSGSPAAFIAASAGLAAKSHRDGKISFQAGRQHRLAYPSAPIPEIKFDNTALMEIRQAPIKLTVLDKTHIRDFPLLGHLPAGRDKIQVRGSACAVLVARELPVSINCLSLDVGPIFPVNSRILED